MISQSLIFVGIEGEMKKPKQPYLPRKKKKPKPVNFQKTHADMSTVTTHFGPVDPRDSSG